MCPEELREHTIDLAVPRRVRDVGPTNFQSLPPSYFPLNERSVRFCLNDHLRRTVMTMLMSDPGQVDAIDRWDADEYRPQRVLVVDDSELVQVGLKALLTRERWVASCLSASSAALAVDVARRRHPHLILVSTSIRGESGLQLCRALRRSVPLAKVVLMSNQGRVSASLAVAHGAVGFVPQQMPAAALVAALREVVGGARVFPRDDVDNTAVQLSKRELDVLQHLVCGLSNPEVATALNLSRHTVKQHTSVVYRKLGVRNRAQAASRAQELGLVA